MKLFGPFARYADRYRRRIFWGVACIALAQAAESAEADDRPGRERDQQPRPPWLAQRGPLAEAREQLREHVDRHHRRGGLRLVPWAVSAKAG